MSRASFSGFGLRHKLVCGFPFLGREAPAESGYPLREEDPSESARFKSALCQFEAEFFASISEMVSVWGPMKRLARFWARRGSLLAPAVAFWACSRWASRGPERVIRAAANSICASLPFCEGPLRASAFFTRE